MAPKRKRGAAQTTGGTKKGKQQGGKDRLEREQEEHEVPRPGDAESDSGSPAAGRGADSAAESPRSAGQNGSADREHPPARSRAAAAKPRAASEGDCGVSGGQPASEAFRVIAGSYERLLYGLDARWTPETGCGGGGGGGAQKLKLAPVFIYPSHVGCIKTVAVGGKFLASGSSDEVIRLYDLRRRKELGVLMQHKGEDGTISIWRTSDWECLKTMKGHLGRVNDLAIHPTGKIALSVGSDKTLRLWNLMNGRKVMATNLNQEGEYVRFSPSGTRYAVCSNKTVDIYSAADAKVSLSITAPNRVCSIAVHQAEDGKEYLM
ncbi:MAG: WD40 repeat-like protein, partial [Olpidium bornovanus]